jgi:hypothetical protein
MLVFCTGFLDMSKKSDILLLSKYFHGQLDHRDRCGFTSAAGNCFFSIASNKLNASYCSLVGFVLFIFHTKAIHRLLALLFQLWNHTSSIHLVCTTNQSFQIR